MSETRAEYIARVVAEAPPLTSEQLDLIAVLLVPGAKPDTNRGPSARELEQKRLAQEREDAMKAAKNLALSMTACDVCDLQPEAHEFQKSYGTFHEWAPGRAAKVLAS